MNRRIFCVVFFFLASALAQDQPAYSLKRFFEGKKIIVRVDMPATNEGVDVYPEREFALNFDDYGSASSGSVPPSFLRVALHERLQPVQRSFPLTSD